VAASIDGRVAAAEALVRRLTDPQLGAIAMDELLSLFHANRSGSAELDPKEARALQARWTAYIATHRSQVASGKVPIGNETKNLVPDGTTLQPPIN
jgi:hypothetical protein